MSRPASFARYVNCPPAAGALVSIAGVFRCSKPGHVPHAGATSASRQVSESLVPVVFRHCLSCCVLYYCGDKRHLLRSYVVVAAGLCGSFALANGVESLGGVRGEGTDGTDATTRSTAALQQLLYYNRVHTCSTVCHIKVCSIGIHSLYATSTNHHHELPVCIMLGSAYMYHIISYHIVSYHVISCHINLIFSSHHASLACFFFRCSGTQLPLNTARRGT